MFGLIAGLLGVLTVALTAGVADDGSASVQSIAIEQRESPPRVVLVFVDSLAEATATDATRMPALSRLAREGASFTVEPCRDQLTYLCIRAALTGRDDSSLLGLADNFRPSHEGPPDTLLSAITQKKGRISVIGSSDFHPYRAALFSERALAKDDETPENVLALLRAANGDAAQLVVVSLSRADMVAHAHGVASAEYIEAFARVDRIVGQIADSLEPQTQLVVFGDHGHDQLGRHLPGTDAKTWALYHGPAFRAGARASLRITDHRALLGVLLGVPTEARYRGPPLSAIFRDDWLETRLGGRIPALAAPKAASSGSATTPWVRLAVICASSLLGAWLWSARHAGSGAVVVLAASVLLCAAATGIFYDSIRSLLHDHGDSPERGLSLLLPLGLGCALAGVIRGAPWFGRGVVRAAWLPTAAGSVLGVTFLLMLPTSYYYGARRALVLAAILAVAALLFHYVRPWRARPTGWLAPSLALAFVALVLGSFYPVRQLGPETAGDALFALDASIYRDPAWLALIVAKLVLFFTFIAPHAARRPLDVAGAASLLSASVLVELAGAQLPPVAYAALFAALVLGSLGARRRMPSSLFAGALLQLDHLYAGDATHLAPIEMLLAATAAALFAWSRMPTTARARAMLAGLTSVVAGYLMLWPTVGFHLAGLDFSFMFQWVRAAQYERWWWIIALGMLVKLALPLVLVTIIARERLRALLSANIVCLGFAAKAASLSVLIAAYAATHLMGSQQATAMLAELLLVVFVLFCSLAALPSRRRAPEPEPEPDYVEVPWQATSVKGPAAAASGP
ncbi:MAG TPA: alkaline phosphatase family protein [Polyangiaceae bacterium]|nr:alkaline phosphatase family protein [Polyangiaceae bacterium]